MPNTPELFADQAHERPDASSETGRKIVFEDDPEPEGPTLPDGRFDGTGDWSRSALKRKDTSGETLRHVELALLMLYHRGRVSKHDFLEATEDRYGGAGSVRLAARVNDLRHDIDEAPPILTDEDAEPTEYYIPKAD